MPPDERIPRRNAAATPFLAWRHRRMDAAAAPVSARKLAASLWRLAPTASDDRLRFEFCSSLPIPQIATEEATKWDIDNEFHINKKLITFTGKAAENHAKEAKQKQNKKAKNEEETEQEMMRSVIRNLAKKIKTERKICKNIENMNSDLLRSITAAKSSATTFIRKIDKEKNAREALDGSCFDLAKEIEATKGEIEALRDRQRRIEMEVEEERRILQMAEVWREEQAQMRLNEAKLMLEYKYVKLHTIISSLRAIGSSGSEETKAAAVTRAFDLVKDLKLLIPESDEEFDVIKDSEARPRGDVRSCESRKTLTNQGSFRSISSSNPHVVRAMKGHIELPRRVRGNGKGERHIIMQKVSSSNLS